jgi:hypothetical protein
MAELERLSTVYGDCFADSLLSANRIQNFAPGNDRLCVDQDKCNDTGLGSAIDPVVDCPALDEHVAGPQTDDLAIQHHVDLAGNDDCVID